MSQQLATLPPLTVVPASPAAPALVKLDHWRYFDFTGAIRAFLTPFHAMRAGQSFSNLRRRNHTYRQYREGLKRFIAFLKTRQQDGITPFPSAAILQAYVLYLRRPNARHQAPNGKFYRDPHFLVEAKHHPLGHVLSSTTINTYLAPVRGFIRHLNPAPIPIAYSANPAEMFLALQLRDEVDKITRQLQQAANFKGIAADVIQGDAALYAHGKRLSQDALYAIFASIRQNSPADLRRLRDEAIFYLFVFSGMRISSIGALQRGQIKEEGAGTYSANPTHKGRKRQAVAVSEIAVFALDRYIAAYNAAIPANDPRRITADTPVWRNLTPRTHRPFDELSAAIPTGDGMIRDVVKKHSRAAGYPVSPHDLRRTLAALAAELGMSMSDLSEQLCHSSYDMTVKYIGRKRDFAAKDIAKLEGFTLADRLAQPLS
jgi:integrase